MAWKGYKPEEIVAKANCNVRYWHKADIPACVDLCPLSGVKRTSTVTDQQTFIYEYTA
jgi:hypothetical protein